MPGLKTRKLLILRDAKNAKNAQIAEVRYTAGTRGERGGFRSRPSKIGSQCDLPHPDFSDLE
jgi:hypothetical protein